MNLTLTAPADLDDFAELFGSASCGLAHLELRDGYAVDFENELWRWWVDNGRPNRLPRDENAYWDLTVSTVQRGVEMRRARVVSTPVSEYHRFLHAGAPRSIECGERLRWLSRDLASDLRLPGNDFWLVDRSRVLFNVFDGAGRPSGKQISDDPEVVDFCAAAFEAVWERATDHAEFHI